MLLLLNLSRIDLLSPVTMLSQATQPCSLHRQILVMLLRFWSDVASTCSETE